MNTEPTLNEQVQDIRARIWLLRESRESVWAQARSRSEVHAYIRDNVADWGQKFEKRARLNLRLLAAGHVGVDLLGENAYRREVALGEALVARFGTEAVEDMLTRHLEAEVPPGLDKAERSARLFQIEADLEALEREEEALIEASEQTDRPIARRRDAKPHIVLGERDPVPQRRSPHYMGLDNAPPKRPPQAAYPSFPSRP